jgi:RimJ/RimL family protein N-acetyltransferase
MCEYLREHRVGTRAAIRVDPDNHGSVRVAEKSGFMWRWPAATWHHVAMATYEVALVLLVDSSEAILKKC